MSIGLKAQAQALIVGEVTVEAVIGRISQIAHMQQQLLAPGSGGSSAPGGATGSATPSAGGASNFATALASAQAPAGGSPIPGDPGVSPVPGALGATGVPGARGLPGAIAPAGTSADPRVQAMVAQAESLVGRPYAVGGGHAGWSPSSAYDCSGFVSKVLHAGGYLSQPVDTRAMPNQPGMSAGPGQFVTVYDRALPGQSGHVIIQINGQFYESGGGAGPWGGGGGVQRIGVPSAAYLARFPTVLHPSGL